MTPSKHIDRKMPKGEPRLASFPCNLLLRQHLQHLHLQPVNRYPERVTENYSGRPFGYSTRIERVSNFETKLAERVRTGGGHSPTGLISVRFEQSLRTPGRRGFVGSIHLLSGPCCQLRDSIGLDPLG